MNIRFFNFHMNIFWSPPGEISENGCYVCYHHIYMYTGATLWDLLRDMVGNWKSDRNLAM